MDAWRGQRAFVTGGSSGIGLATARALVAAGAHVVVGARGAARLAEAEEALRRAAGPEQRVGSVVLDVADAASVEAAAAAALARLGGLDLLVNNAGMAYPARFLDLPAEVFEATMRVNYLGAVNVTRALLPALRDGGGRIVNVASVAGFLGVYGYTAYAASKFALVGFSECLRQEVRGDGVTVTVVYPPDTDTPQLAAEDATKPPETRHLAGTVKPLQPEQVAAALLRGAARGRAHVTPGAGAGFLRFMQHAAPWLVRRIMDAQLAGFRRRQGGP